MNTFESLAIALRGHFHKSFAQLPLVIQQRVQADFSPWPWDSQSSRERCHRAKQWDYENDPGRREMREGIEALTNPDSPAYSPEETQRLRGDFLPQPRNVRPPAILPPMEWENQQPFTVPRNVFGIPTNEGKTANNIKSAHSTASSRPMRSGLLTPLITAAQSACGDPYDTPSVWAKLREMAVAKKTPFIGVTDEGLQWIDGNDHPQYLSLGNLRERLKRQKKPAG